MNLRDARNLFDVQPGWLNTASYGIPPRPAWDALQAALADWRAGATSWEPWGEETSRSRSAFARLVGADPADVSIGSTVSGLLSLVGTALPDGAEVLVPDGEFTSAVFPWKVLAHRGVVVRSVPLDRIAESIRRQTTMVVFGLVQSATGEVAPVPDILAAAAQHSTLTCTDATQATGWLPVDATRFDVLVAGAYKWLMAPRGTAFMVVRPQLRERMVPLQAGWFAGEDVHDSYYGPNMRLASDGRRFDTSPAWFSWVGTTPALDLLNDVGVDAVHTHNLALANRFRAGLGLPPDNSAIVSVDVPGAAERLHRAGIRAAVRDGRLRASFHLYTDGEDVDRALDALGS